MKEKVLEALKGVLFVLVYLVALAEALAYLGAVPVWAALWIDSSDGLRAGVGLSAFEPRFALRRARKNSFALTARPSKEKPRKGRAWRLLRKLSIDEIRLRGTLGLGDAAATAMACGAIRAAAAVIGTRAVRAELAIAPDFRETRLRVELSGMIRARSGQIILAAARSGAGPLNVL